MRFNMKPKKMVQLSLGAASIVALTAVLDLTAGIFYGRAVMMDIMFVLSAVIVIYLAVTVYREIN